ncbi:ABC transporter ATP-binding protein [Desulfovibrio sp. OttesenSCG-928-I05]|nr:ABC transporter ATP-binding protein [Desulfovibrio sp. OttesenSCG-928-I05]
MSNNPTAALELSGLSFTYPCGRQILEDVSFTVQPGTVCGLFGPNGSGKSTLFRCCLGLLSGAAGSIRINGEDARTFEAKELARRVAYVPQESQIRFPFLVRELVAMGRTPHLRGIFGPSRADHRIITEAMEKAGVAAFAETPCTELSGGQRQLVALAKALAQDARIMLLDEPASALDFSNQILIWQTLRSIAAKGVAVLVCTHDPNHILWFCDQVAVLHKGRLLATGPCAETLTPELLHTLYDVPLEISRPNGFTMIHPAEL